LKPSLFVLNLIALKKAAIKGTSMPHFTVRKIEYENMKMPFVPWEQGFQPALFS